MGRDSPPIAMLAAAGRARALRCPIWAVVAPAGRRSGKGEKLAMGVDDPAERGREAKSTRQRRRQRRRRARSRAARTAVVARRSSEPRRPKAASPCSLIKPPCATQLRLLLSLKCEASVLLQRVGALTSSATQAIQ